MRRTFYADLDRGSIFAAGGAIVAPTGKESEGLGSGFWIYEPFAMWGQMSGTNAFLQVHAGVEFPSDQALGDTEAFARTAFGFTFARDQGFGLAWTPMLEVLTASPQGARHRVGRGASGAGLSEQVATHPAQRWCSNPAQRA